MKMEELLLYVAGYETTHHNLNANIRAKRRQMSLQ
jgi:hypothetical protein